jgi:hypothetical protein
VSNVLLFYVDADGITVRLRESTDHGATFSAAVTIATAGAAVGWMAAAMKSDGIALLVYSVGAIMYAVKRSSGIWGSPAAWSNSVGSVTGVACLYQSDFNIAICGSDANSNTKVWTAIYGDGYSQAVGTWSALQEVTTANAGSNVSFQAPSLSYPDEFRLCFVEKYTGTEAYTRPYFAYSPATADYVNNLWREPFPLLDISSDYGLAMAYNATHAWLSSPGDVWRASLTTPTLDVTANVLELNAEDRSGAGRLRLSLRNDDGRYLTLGANAALRLGSEVRVSPGYMTTAGNQASDGPAYWIEGYEHTSGDGVATLVIEAADGWSLLEGWRARRQYAWAEGQQNVFQLLSFVFARAGLEFASLGNSATITNLYPSFAIHPGENGATAARRLLSMVPDILFLRGHFGYLRNPLASEASAYSYGASHSIRRGRYGVASQAVNRVQAYGDGLLVETYDWDSIADLYDRLQQVHDLNLDTIAKGQERGAAVLRREDMASGVGEIVVLTNCGQELYDVIDVTDATAGLSAARERVLGLNLRYLPKRGVYEQRLLLGNV